MIKYSEYEMSIITGAVIFVIQLPAKLCVGFDFALDFGQRLSSCDLVSY